MRNRYLVSLVELSDDFSVLVYDFKKKEVVDDVVQYAHELIKSLGMARLSIHQEIGHLRVFLGYMSARRTHIEIISDEFLEGFRDYMLGRLPNSLSKDIATADKARRTVNSKLVRVYDWLKWLDENNKIPNGIIGPIGCRIYSCLAGSSVSKNSKKNADFKYSDLYPLLLKIHTKKSKHKVPKFIPSEDTLDALHEYFFGSCHSLHIKHRNSLLVDVASYTGFRRNSIQSLTISQFIGSDFEYSDRETVRLRPVRQKFNYGDYYEIPIELHQNVCNFIRDQRAEVLKIRGVGEPKTEGAVFISDRTCTPLDDRSITAIVSKALRACGAPKGFSIHSFRSKYLVAATTAEYEDRKELGLDTSAETVMRAVSVKVGHKNPNSVRPYTAGHDASALVKHHNSKARKEKEQLSEIERLRAEVEELKRKLKKSGGH